LGRWLKRRFVHGGSPHRFHASDPADMLRVWLLFNSFHSTYYSYLINE
jgi:hypothetical protein